MDIQTFTKKGSIFFSYFHIIVYANYTKTYETHNRTIFDISLSLAGEAYTTMHLVICGNKMRKVNRLNCQVKQERLDERFIMIFNQTKCLSLNFCLHVLINLVSDRE